MKNTSLEELERALEEQDASVREAHASLGPHASTPIAMDAAKLEAELEAIRDRARAPSRADAMLGFLRC